MYFFVVILNLFQDPSESNLFQIAARRVLTRAIGKFLMVGFIYRCFTFDVTVSVYSQTQDTAPTGALRIDEA